MRRPFVTLLALLLPVPLGAQSWNDPDVTQLIRRAILLREMPASDSALHSYRAKAHGLVTYLVQSGPGFPDPPRLGKADELDVEVYWEAPNLSKQRITAWRDGSFLPMQVIYHRDHLGIITNNFGPLIRIGDGDEVRDAIHPLSLEGLDEYDFAIQDTVRLKTLKGELEVLAVQVRPRDVRRPLVLGMLYLERRTAALVRFQFSFTPAAYRQPELEDLSVVLEQSLLEGRWWLPYAQQFEIRRRASVVDFPIRTIIRGHWDIGEYEFGEPMPAELKSAPEYGGLRAPVRDTTRWTASLRTVVDQADPFDRRQFDELKARAQDLASRQLLEGMPRRRLGASSLSDLVHVNRVQGLAFGFGLGARFNGGYALRGSVGFGLSDHRLTAGLGAGITRGATEWSFDARRVVRDIGDEPVVSGVINSLISQESGKDLGSYLLGEELGLGVLHHVDPRWSLALATRVEHTASVETRARPLRGVYQDNPALGSGTYVLGRATVTLAARGALDRSDFKAQLGLEGGAGPTEYLRAGFRSDGSVPIPLGHLRLRTVAGVASSGLPKARSFTIGGRGTLPGEVFRGYGGRRIFAAQVEWRIPVPVPAIGLGPFATTGNRATLAPLFGIGWAGGAIEGLPWTASDGPRPVFGVAAEFLQGLIRIEAARRIRFPADEPRPKYFLAFTFDVSPEWWPIL
ncbi:MAG TPA: hypothetical protein VL241_02630 [Gemmatimonadales bacterium]|nr:hypothetical protein [Gemmatimonadales bacterium]